MSENDDPNWQLVEAGTGGKQMGTFETKDQAREYVEDRFGESPSPANGCLVWKGKKRPGRSRYILKLRKVLTDGGRPSDGVKQPQQDIIVNSDWSGTNE